MTINTMHPLKHTIMLLFMALTLILTACAPPEPVYIFITPTPQSEPELAQTQDIVITVETAVAQMTDPTITTEQIQLSPTPTIITGDFFGAIIGEGYTLPPTSTHRPTQEPIAIPTETPIPPLPIDNIPRLNANQLGIQVYTNLDIDTFYNMMVQAQVLGVKWIKLQANWAFLQPNSPDDYDQNFRLFESHVQRAKNMGFNVLISIAKAPSWARSIQGEYDGPPDDPQLLANFTEQLITRIKAENIDAIEIWNEPNLLREWQGTLPLNGAGYMQLFVPTYERIQAVAPQIQIISAAPAPTSNSEFSRDDRTYLQEMYDNGLANYTNIVIGVHPYGWGNPPDATCCATDPDRGWNEDPHFFFLDNINDYSAIIRANGHNVPMWLTELGWATWDKYPSDPPEIWMTYNDERLQAEYLLRSLEIAQERDDIELSIVWALNFGGEQGILNQEEVAAYSLIYALPEIGLQFRPAFEALSLATYDEE